VAAVGDQDEEEENEEEAKERAAPPQYPLRLRHHFGLFFKLF